MKIFFYFAENEKRKSWKKLLFILQKDLKKLKP